MKLKDEQKRVLNFMVTECCKHADCEMIAAVFKAADWTWADPILGDDYNPDAREIRSTLYRLGKNLLNDVIEKYESGQWKADDPFPHNIMSGRLYFTIDWHSDNGDGSRFLEDMDMSCGLSTEFASTTIVDVSLNDYTIETYGDEQDRYTELFQRHVE